MKAECVGLFHPSSVRRPCETKGKIMASSSVIPHASSLIPHPSSVLQDPTIIEFDVRTDEMLVNMGPQHPSTHGVLRLVLSTRRSGVPEGTPHLGYLHRCAAQIGGN